MPRRPGALALLLLASLAFLVTSLCAAPRQGERAFEDMALAPLAADLAAYLDARESTEGLDLARSELMRRVEELNGEDEQKDLLRHPADLARALWLSRAYDKEKLKKGKLSEDVFERGGFEGAGLEYAYWLPKDYDPRRAAYPLLLVIPDEGEGPAEHLREHWTVRALREQAIVVCPEMPAGEQDWTRVIVAGRPGGLGHVLAALRIATERFAVDFDRVFVLGRGKGVTAALAAGNYAPQRFAGIVGRAGDAGPSLELFVDNFANLPTYFAGAGAKATAFQEAARAVGIDNVTLDPSAKEEAVWSWMQSRRRATFPESVTVMPGNPFPTRVSWLQIAPSEADVRVTARIDRDSNTVRIEGRGASYATLYLNDALVDLDRPLRVVAAGVETTTRIERRLASTLDMIYDGTSDPGCVYTAWADYDLSGAAVAAEGGRAAGPDPEYDERLAAAGDADALWELAQWCGATGRDALREQSLRRLVRLHPDHEDARAALGHRPSPAQWFTSEDALERFERRQDPERAKARGHVEYKSLWMHPDERALVTKGLVKDQETGQWLSADDRKRLAAGWVRQDLAWIPPADASRVDEGLWFVGGEWLELPVADRRRSRIDTMWRIPTAEVLLYSTADRVVSLRAIEEARRSIEEAQRVFGAEPPLPLRVALLRDEAQYDGFAAGEPDGRRPGAHADRLHVIHSAFLAESWFPRVEGVREFGAMGVAYWDNLAPNGDLYGVHAARLAAALSYVDALDPSPKAVRRALKDGPGRDYFDAYEAEKKLPAWLRWGGAVYAERYFHDDTVGDGGDPWWPRAWSLENLANKGGMRPLEEVFAFALDPDARDDAHKLMIEVGLVVAFLVDGGCAPASEAHAEFKRAMASGRLHGKHVDALREALVAHEKELRAFAGE